MVGSYLGVYVGYLILVAYVECLIMYTGLPSLGSASLGPKAQPQSWRAGVDSSIGSSQTMLSFLSHSLHTNSRSTKKPYSICLGQHSIGTKLHL